MHNHEVIIDLSVKVGLVIRDGRKLLRSETISIHKALEVADCARKSKTLTREKLKEGHKVKFKHNKLNFTLEPLHNHIDRY